ncbi:hypothetical protein BH11BAC2_BH11BAC2_05910 [soil metagenome]
MKNALLLLILLGIFSNVMATETPAVGSDRQLLVQLLNERKEKFSDFTSSLDEASGFFGNQTKKDVKKSNEILKDIVRLDNKMISILNRRVDFKTYETTTMNYQQLDCENKLAESRTALDNLMKIKNSLAIERIELIKKIWFYKILSSILLLILIGLILRKKFAGRFILKQRNRE